MPAKVKVELYRWAGSLGPFRISSECVECDFAVAAVREVLSAHPDWPVELEIKPWLNHLWQALNCGGWHAPVLVVGNRLVSQGRVPSPRQIEAAIQFALARRQASLPSENPGVDVASGCC